MLRALVATFGDPARQRRAIQEHNREAPTIGL
jgi:hypothetical protein